MYRKVEGLGPKTMNISCSSSGSLDSIDNYRFIVIE